ncbi:MAG: asparagine--tRNA ligase [Spirochaetaceae bacterium]|jgi:asparaginyl-tRNA synthetase|nr:asparagine--tRNA ligase [Spirochaetaceae bacterium]
MMLIKEILALPADSREIRVYGWVRTKREMKNLVFVEVNDGSCIDSIQCTFERRETGEEDRSGKQPRGENSSAGADVFVPPENLSTGASVEIWGRLVPSPARGQAVEVAARGLRVIGEAPPETYPLQKKRHSPEFLREIAHLRARTNTSGAVARVRSRLAFAIHEFFQSRGFQYIHTPIITANDAEGAGAMFQVTTLDLEALARSGAPPDYSRDFFGKKTFLTVSGQLEAETYAAALSRVYTFGPTFRAEKSNTTRHLAEFWMIEPEAAFFHLEDNMALAEDFLKTLFSTALRDNAADLAFFDSHIEQGIIDNLQSLSVSRFAYMTYTEAMEELRKNADRFEFKPYWGCDLQSEHERFLTETVIRGPLIVTDYPKEIKAFYMKMNDDGKTVRAMDVLVPRLGEIIGGSEREENPEGLEQRIIGLGMSPADYSWYLDLRRYGTVPHSGFGLGFERLIQYVTGMANIRDVIPYPRAVGQAEF